MNLNAKTYFSIAKKNKELEKKLLETRDENIQLCKRIIQLLTIINKAMDSDDPKQAIRDNWIPYEEEK